MKVLVTGAKGFIGKNLISHLNEMKDVEIVTFDKEDSFDKIENEIDNIKFIFHLAGINRPVDNKEFYEGNTDLTRQLIDVIKGKNIPLIITSSIQAAKDNDYGKSKKMAEDIVKEYANDNQAYIFRLHNVFGKWCRPNYNSFIATFCNNIANDLDITVNDPSSEVELVYIDDVVKEFISIMQGNKPTETSDGFNYINPKYKKTVGEIADMLYSFKDSMSSIMVPSTGDDFTKKLYSTFVSYISMEKMAVSATKNTDERGSFTELTRTMSAGQFSISFSKPGVVRGNHYHHTKMERFIVVKGHARIGFTNIVTGDSYEFEVDDSDIKIITIPVGFTHNIENIGDDEMILAIWCNELFDKENPDTFFKPVNLEKVKKLNKELL